MLISFAIIDHLTRLIFRGNEIALKLSNFKVPKQNTMKPNAAFV